MKIAPAKGFSNSILHRIIYEKKHTVIFSLNVTLGLIILLAVIRRSKQEMGLYAPLSALLYLLEDPAHSQALINDLGDLRDEWYNAAGICSMGSLLELRHIIKI